MNLTLACAALSCTTPSVPHALSPGSHDHPARSSPADQAAVQPTVTPQPRLPPQAVAGVRRRTAIDMALEVASRDEVQRVRADWSRARRRRLRGNVAAAESDALTAQLESAIGALAQVLCEGFPAPRINAIGSLVDLAEHVVEAAESIDPGAGRRCEAEGGDPADCELIDGSQYSELGEAEHALEEARSAASISTLQAECAPEDTDLDPPATGARR